MNGTGVAVAVAAASLAVAIAVGTVSHGDVSSLTSQIRAQQTEITQLRGQVADARQQLSGARQDVITCTDLQTVETYIDGLAASQGDIGGAFEFVGPDGSVVTSLPLPSHCING
jgi:hypothetical protein